jgi:hypothetical protein
MHTRLEVGAVLQRRLHTFDDHGAEFAQGSDSRAIRGDRRIVRNVTHFLLVFDRDHGRLLREQGYQDNREALRERFRVERMHRGNNVEVVVLTADSRDALRHTHSRYFESLSDLAARRSTSLMHAPAVDEARVG